MATNETPQQIAAAQKRQKEFQILEHLRDADAARVEQARKQDLWRVLSTWATPAPTVQFTTTQERRVKHVDVEIVEPKQLPPPKAEPSD